MTTQLQLQLGRIYSGIPTMSLTTSPPGPCIVSNDDGTVVWTYYWALLLEHVLSLIMSVQYCGHTTGQSCWIMYVP